MAILKRLAQDRQNVDRNLMLSTEAESLLGSKAGLIIAWHTIRERFTSIAVAPAKEKTFPCR